VEAIGEGAPAHIREELGDIFLLVTMLAYMHEQEGLFSVADTLNGITEKLIRRHPHVFDKSAGPEPPLSTDKILENWARMKVEQEGRKPKDSILDEVSGGLPPLEKAWKLQKKAAKAGFDWPNAAGVIDKIKEELAEVEAAGAGRTDAPGTPSGRSAIERDSPLEGELGDLLFSVVNLCRFYSIDASLALQRTNNKFTERFRHVERRMKENGQEMNAKNLTVMDQYWNEAKC
jgi:tetrapyrrole methylase family protein/MazG family protein